MKFDINDFLNALKHQSVAQGFSKFYSPNLYGKVVTNIPELSQTLTFNTDNEVYDCIKSVLQIVECTNINFFDVSAIKKFPALVLMNDYSFNVLMSIDNQGNPGVYNGSGVLLDYQNIKCVISFDFPYLNTQTSPIYNTIIRTFKSNKKIYIDAVISTVLINILALGTSLYSMQVYDRVIPIQGYYTLAVLTIAVLFASLLKFLCEIVRSNLSSHIIKSLDVNLSSEVFGRLLNVRLDQMPSTLGGLSSRIKSYESIRVFLSSTTIYVLVDAPFALFFLIIISLISSIVFPIIILVFLFLSLVFGLLLKAKTDQLAVDTHNTNANREGMLVEIIDGSETIKCSGSTWGLKSKWMGLTHLAVDNSIRVRSITEKITLITHSIQQLAYVVLITTGAYMVAEGLLTLGALAATTILSSRILGPISSIPGLLSQFSTVKASYKSLNDFYQLETDNHGNDNPLMPRALNGNYELRDVIFSYNSINKPFKIEKLNINTGDRVGVLGPVGSGKSTLLRILTGMYKVSEGTITLDNIDILNYDKLLLNSNIGYLQQDHRLFNGTLRDNLLLGMDNPGDDILLNACKKTGLISVINNNPLGFDLRITEGGRGLSGGQKQLLAFTRICIVNPNILLLDEPTASMDPVSERKVMDLIAEFINDGKTILMVTHKASLLNGFNRIIFLNNNGIVFDESKEVAFEKLGLLVK